MAEASPQDTPSSPTIYFIDDSATMREVIRGAFQRESMKVIACPDGVTALAQMEETRPDVVITDVIMPGKDGYEVCQFVKQHPRMTSVPVILLSGVVNRDVAQKAFRVKADELIRKPFLPQELIARVRQLISPKSSTPAVSASASGSAEALTSIFTGAAEARPPAAPATALPSGTRPARPSTIAARAPVSPAAPKPAAEAYRLRLEILRLESLVKKLQTELDAEREYGRALDAHLKSLHEVE